MGRGKREGEGHHDFFWNLQELGDGLGKRAEEEGGTRKVGREREKESELIIPFSLSRRSSAMARMVVDALGEAAVV